MKIPVVAVKMKPVEPRAHKQPCPRCPSAYFPPDPEVQDIMRLPHQERVQTAFPCGWNGIRYCRGYCDQMGITDTDLATLPARR